MKTAVLTRRAPTSRENEDIAFGWGLAKEMGRLDVGRSVAVKERSVLAVEAIEGTDLAITRAGDLCPRGGFTVVRVNKSQQGMAAIGTEIVETLHRAGGRVLAVEAEQPLVDEQTTIDLANRYGLTIVARTQITIRDGAKTHEYKRVADVPKEYRAKVDIAIRISQTGALN